MKYILALDQGTTSSRAIIFDKKGAIKGSAQQEYPQIYPKAGWVEHNPQDILASQVGVVAEAVMRAGISSADIESVGITNQRETTVVWDKETGEAVYNAIVWQCRRTTEYCEQLCEQDGVEQMILDKTGLVLDAYFSATKIKWILDNVDGARQRAEEGKLLFGTIDTFLMWHLSNGRIFATDYTNASRTMLFNIHTLQWDEELLELFGVPRSMLATVHPSSHRFGYISGGIVGKDVPICGVAGDQQAALFGQLCTSKGTIKNTYGTGCFMLMNTGDTAVYEKGLVTTLAASGEGKPQYVLEGSVFVGGAVVQWLRDELKMISSSKDTEKIAMSVTDTNGVYVVPAFVGLGAPHWDPFARGVITGLTRGSKREHIVRAALESIAYQVGDILKVMEKSLGQDVVSLNVDGGACKNNFLMQFQSDILKVDVQRPKVVETTALGAAYLAGLCSGYWESEEDIRKNKTVERVFSPNMEESTRQSLITGWNKSVKQSQLT